MGFHKFLSTFREKTLSIANKMLRFVKSLAPRFRVRLDPLFFFLQCKLGPVLVFTIILGLALIAFVSWRVQPTIVETILETIMRWVPDRVVVIANAAVRIAAKYPGRTFTSAGVLVPLLIFFLTRPDRRLQRRRIYMDLEFESARIFRTSVDHPEIVRYLEGSRSRAEIDQDVSERAYWYVCQVLNTFELMIALYKEGMVQVDIFSTWVSWFHELGTAQGFGEFWNKRGLSFHYKIELQEIMDTAQELLRSRKAVSGDDHELGIFHERVSRLLNDPRIRGHYKKSRKGKARRIKQGLPRAVGSPQSANADVYNADVYS
jgi:hypothetical protein